MSSLLVYAPSVVRGRSNVTEIAQIADSLYGLAASRTHRSGRHEAVLVTVELFAYECFIYPPAQSQSSVVTWPGSTGCTKAPSEVSSKGQQRSRRSFQRRPAVSGERLFPPRERRRGEEMAIALPAGPRTRSSGGSTFSAGPKKHI